VGTARALLLLALVAVAPSLAGATCMITPDANGHVSVTEVTRIGDSAFNGCESLVSIEIGGRVTYIGEQAFCWCTSLVSVVIRDSVTHIDRAAFSRVASLKSLVIDAPAFIDDGAFYGLTGLTSLSVR